MLTALFEDTRNDYNHIFSFVTLMIPVNTSDVTNFNNKNMAATRKFKLRNSQRILITTLGPAKIIASNSEPTTIFFKQVNS